MTTPQIITLAVAAILMTWLLIANIRHHRDRKRRDTLSRLSESPKDESV